ncbi:MAG: GntR family transcriptional regulator [Deltaproteobacteria bacterium]|nr:GntR family transcriptional regulator [Deltaproteobacteria bacterium]
MANNNKTKTLIEDAYRRIKGMIFEQRLVPGQKLVYQDLVNLLNMSQTPIINALNRLEQEGFVASETFRGFYVKPIDLDEVWENFGVREALEVYAVKQVDYEFHLQIAAMAKNSVLKYLLKRNLEHIYLRARLDDYDPRRMASSTKEHGELVERMKRKDTIGSIEVIQNHIQTARDHVIRCLSDQESDEKEYGYI